MNTILILVGVFATFIIFLLWLIKAARKETGDMKWKK